MSTQLRHHYTPEDIDRGLLTLAACGGNSAEAARRLEAAGHPIPDDTLRAWRLYRHTERYAELHERHARDIEGALVHQFRDAAIREGELKAKLAERLETQVDDMDAKEAAGALKSVALSQGIAVDKLLILTGRPTHITETHNADELVRKLESLRLTAIPSTATEIPTVPLITQTNDANARELDDKDTLSS